MANNSLPNPLDISYTLFERLEKAGVRYCHWKSNQHLDDALAGQTDLDVLVARGQANLAEYTLRGLGFKRVNSQPWASYPGINDWLGFDEDTGRLIHLHLHYQLLTGLKFVKEQHLPWEELILETAIKDPQYKIFIIDPNLEIILLVIRVALKTSIKRLSLAYLGQNLLPANILDEFNYLLERVDEEKVHKLAINILKSDCGQIVWNVIQDRSLNKPGSILRIKSALGRALDKHRRYSRLKIVTRYLSNFSYFFLAKTMYKFKMPSQVGKRLHTGGVIIAVIGCDGAGKSTISRELRQWLSWKIDTHQMYLGSGEGSIGTVNRLLKFLASRSVHRPATPRTPPQHQSNGNYKKSGFRELGSVSLGFSLARARYKKALTANKFRLNGGIVVTDRYPQNQYTGIYDGPRINGAASRVGRFLARRELEIYESIVELNPDLVVKLHVPIEVAISRKPDHGIENIRRKAEITSKIAFTGATVIDIDASACLEDVVKSVKKEVWNSLGQ